MYDLTGRFLIATPSMDDPRFQHSVAYICEHTKEGAMALVINQPLKTPLSCIIEGMDIRITNSELNKVPVVNGGPVQPEMGCVLHPRGQTWDSTFDIGEISVTTSKDILAAMAEQNGPDTALVTLGYAAWTGNQLEWELADNVWFTSQSDLGIVFDLAPEKRWATALATLGVDLTRLFNRVGHA